LKTLLSFLAAVFSIAIYWAFTQKPISESGAWLIKDPWGIVTLIDLYIGFFLFSLFMYFTSIKKRSLLIWVPALMGLGNIIALVYLIFHYKRLKNMMTGGRPHENN